MGSETAYMQAYALASEIDEFPFMCRFNMTTSHFVLRDTFGCWLQTIYSHQLFVPWTRAIWSLCNRQYKVEVGEESFFSSSINHYFFYTFSFQSGRGVLSVYWLCKNLNQRKITPSPDSFNDRFDILHSSAPMKQKICDIYTTPLIVLKCHQFIHFHPGAKLQRW